VVRDGADVAQQKPADTLPAKVEDAVTVGRADAPEITSKPARRESKRANHREKRGVSAADDDGVEM
jgi:hypothetical protein